MHSPGLWIWGRSVVATLTSALPTDNCHVKVVPANETVSMFRRGDCVNAEGVVGVIRCQGACDSMAFFDAGKSASCRSQPGTSVTGVWTGLVEAA